MRPFLAAVLCVAIAPALAAGQAPPDFSRIDAKPGDTLYVTDANSREIGGTLERLTPSELSIAGRTFEPAFGLRIERRGDSLWNGTLIGAGIGAVAGATIGAEACLHRSRWPCAVGGAALYAGIGALIDWAHKGRTVVYDTRQTRRPVARVFPILSPRERGIALTVSVGMARGR